MPDVYKVFCFTLSRQIVKAVNKSPETLCELAVLVCVYAGGVIISESFSLFLKEIDFFGILYHGSDLEIKLLKLAF